MTEEDPRNIRVVCRGCAEEYKGTFDIEIGDYAKIRFGQYDSRGEYMWVNVTSVNGDKLEGTLDNDPVVMENMKYEDTIIFWKGDICGKIKAKKGSV